MPREVDGQDYGWFSETYQNSEEIFKCLWTTTTRLKSTFFIESCCHWCLILFCVLPTVQLLTLWSMVLFFVTDFNDFLALKFLAGRKKGVFVIVCQVFCVDCAYILGLRHLWYTCEILYVLKYTRVDSFCVSNTQVEIHWICYNFQFTKLDVWFSCVLCWISVEIWQQV